MVVDAAEVIPNDKDDRAVQSGPCMIALSWSTTQFSPKHRLCGG